MIRFYSDDDKPFEIEILAKDKDIRIDFYCNYGRSEGSEPDEVTDDSIILSIDKAKLLINALRIAIKNAQK